MLRSPVFPRPILSLPFKFLDELCHFVTRNGIHATFALQQRQFSEEFSVFWTIGGEKGETKETMRSKWWNSDENIEVVKEDLLIISKWREVDRTRGDFHYCINCFGDHFACSFGQIGRLISLSLSGEEETSLEKKSSSCCPCSAKR